MSKRELNISNKILRRDSKEDIILKSPLRIPPKGLQDLKNLKGVKITDYAYYDITQSENQQIHHKDPSIINTIYNITGYTEEEYDMIMGEFNDM